MTCITSPDQIQKNGDAGLLKVDVPEWGGHVYLGRLTGVQYQEYLDFISKESSFGVPKPRHAAFIAACLRDENGKPVSNVKQAERWGQSEEAVLTRLFYVAIRHNKLDDESLEGMKKNYETIISNGSHSGSPVT